MNCHEIISRAQAIGVTFKATPYGEVVCERPISPTLAEFLTDKTDNVLKALECGKRVFDLQAERERRRNPKDVA